MSIYTRFLSSVPALLLAGVCNAQSLIPASDEFTDGVNQYSVAPLEYVEASIFNYDMLNNKSCDKCKNIIVTNAAVLGKSNPSSSGSLIHSLAITFSNNQKVTAIGFEKIEGGIYRGLVLDDNMHPTMIVDFSSQGSEVVGAGNINIKITSTDTSIKGEPIIADGYLVDVTSANAVNVEQVLKSMPKIKIKLEEVLATGKSGNKSMSIDSFCWAMAEAHMLEMSFHYDSYNNELYTAVYHNIHHYCVNTLVAAGF